MKGIIFDFNGTLFYDTYMHERIWKQVYFDLTNKEISDEDFHNILFGADNTDIFKNIMGKEISDEFIEEWSEKKEKIYRDYCESHPEEVHLLPGAIPLFEELKKRKIPFNIATGAPKSNVDYYFEVFDLAKWFDYELAVFPYPGLKGKPDPQAYLEACKNIGVKPEDVLVFEDSKNGIRAAARANVAQIIAVDPENKNKDYKKIDRVSRIIKDYTEFNLDDYEWN